MHRFDATKNRLDEFPKIKAWLLHLRPPVPPPFHAPARPPLFIGRVAELDALRTRLAEEGSVVPVEGLAGLGKTTLALEFAHRHKRDFEAVYWLQCVGRDLASLASDLASQLEWRLKAIWKRFWNISASIAQGSDVCWCSTTLTTKDQVN